MWLTFTWEYTSSTSTHSTGYKYIVQKNPNMFPQMHIVSFLWLNSWLKTFNNGRWWIISSQVTQCFTGLLMIAWHKYFYVWQNYWWIHEISILPWIYYEWVCGCDLCWASLTVTWSAHIKKMQALALDTSHCNLQDEKSLRLARSQWQYHTKLN